MKNKLIVHFIKTQSSFISVYLFNTTILILFYSLLLNSREFAYPLFISIFLLVILLITKFYQYKRLINHIDQMIDPVEFKETSTQYLEQKVNSTFHTVHKYYLNQVNQMRMEGKEKQLFFSQWVHNLKTPISVIDLIIQNGMMMETISPSLLEDIDEENKKVVYQLNQLLNLLRLDDFASDFTLEKIDLENQLKQIINSRKKEFIHNKLFPKITSVIDSTIVITDRKWNQFMLNQLISNAIKYSRASLQSKNIYFKLKQDQDYLVLEIQDEGIGIPTHDLKRVFEPFFTGENGRHIKDSTGIGLYMVKKISSKLGHGITIESELNKGTTISLSYKIERL